MPSDQWTCGDPAAPSEIGSRKILNVFQVQLAHTVVAAALWSLNRDSRSMEADYVIGSPGQQKLHQSIMPHPSRQLCLSDCQQPQPGGRKDVQMCVFVGVCVCGRVHSERREEG